MMKPFEEFIIEHNFDQEDQKEEYILKDKNTNEIYYREYGYFKYLNNHSKLGKLLFELSHNVDDTGKVSCNRNNTFNNRIIRNFLLKFTYLQIQLLHLQLKLLIRKKK
jgi:hypothetical protein